MCIRDSFSSDGVVSSSAVQQIIDPGIRAAEGRRISWEQIGAQLYFTAPFLPFILTLTPVSSSSYVWRYHIPNTIFSTRPVDEEYTGPRPPRGYVNPASAVVLGIEQINTLPINALPKKPVASGSANHGILKENAVTGALAVNGVSLQPTSLAYLWDKTVAVTDTARRDIFVYSSETRDLHKVSVDPKTDTGAISETNITRLGKIELTGHNIELIDLSSNNRFYVYGLVSGGGLYRIFLLNNAIAQVYYVGKIPNISGKASIAINQSSSKIYTLDEEQKRLYVTSVLNAQIGSTVDLGSLKDVPSPARVTFRAVTSGGIRGILLDEHSRTLYSFTTSTTEITNLEAVDVIAPDSDDISIISMCAFANLYTDDSSGDYPLYHLREGSDVVYRLSLIHI